MKLRIARKLIRYLYRKKAPTYRWHTFSKAMDVARDEWAIASRTILDPLQPWSKITPGRNV